MAEKTFLEFKPGEFFKLDGSHCVAVKVGEDPATGKAKCRCLILSPGLPRFHLTSIENLRPRAYPKAWLGYPDKGGKRRQPLAGEVVLTSKRRFLCIATDDGSETFIDVKSWVIDPTPLPTGQATWNMDWRVVPWELHDGHGSVICRFPSK
jgi:hypothetical protein